MWPGCRGLAWPGLQVRGPTYLKDRKKIPAGDSRFVLGAMNVISLPEPTQHVARFLPSVR